MKNHAPWRETAYTEGQNGVGELSVQARVQAWMELRMSGEWMGRWRVWQYGMLFVIETSSVYYAPEALWRPSIQTQQHSSLPGIAQFLEYVVCNL